MMNRRSACFLVAVIPSLIAVPVSAELFAFTGIAESSTGKALYEEQHRIEGACENGVFQPLEHRVTYSRQVAGTTEPFAEKRLDYSTSALRPTVTYQQPDFGESLDITYPGSGSATVVWQPPGGRNGKVQRGPFRQAGGGRRL